MGVVDEAEQLSLGVRVALKVLAGHQLLDLKRRRMPASDNTDCKQR